MERDATVMGWVGPLLSGVLSAAAPLVEHLAEASRLRLLADREPIFIKISFYSLSYFQVYISYKGTKG